MNDGTLSYTCEFRLLGRVFTAVAELKSKGCELLMMPSAHQEEDEYSLEELLTGVNDLLVRFHPEKPTKIDIAKVVGDVKEFCGGTPAFRIAQLFLYVTPGDVEYALSISARHVTLNPAELKFLDIVSLTFGIWNTQRKAVLEQLRIKSIDELLPKNV